MEFSILLYTPEFLCWDEETVRIAGDDPAALGILQEMGALVPLGGGYVITPKGEELRARLSSEIGVPSPAITHFITDEAEAARELDHNRMCLLMDRAFKTQWGLKDVSYREVFPLTPMLNDDEYFTIEDGKARALWSDHPLMKSLLERFPHWGVAARKLECPGQAALDDWAKEMDAPSGTFSVDYMLRSRYDFESYKECPAVPTDRFSFCNTDLMYVYKCPEDLNGLLPLIGKLQVFTMLQRRVYLPGYYDIDMHEQDEWTLLCLVTDTEAELETLTSTLRGWDRGLINHALPFLILATSIERLRAQKEPKDTLYDWFDEETVHVMREDVEF